MFHVPRPFSFLEYVECQDDPDRKKRDDLRKLHLLERLIKRGGMTAKLFPKKNRPYLYVWSHLPGMRGGAKVYQEGDQITYKFQSSPGEKQNHDQYETARVLPIQQMFLDFQAESDKTEVQVAMQLADEVARRFKSFFSETRKAMREKARKRDEMGDEGRGNIVNVSPAGEDYGHTMDRPM